MSKDPAIVRHVRQYQSPEIDYSKNKIVSFSQYQIYSTCPHRWRLSYIDREDSYTPSIYTVYGTAMHESMQSYLETLYYSGSKDAKYYDVDERLEESMIETYTHEHDKIGTHISDANEMGEYYENGVKLLRYVQRKRSSYFNSRDYKYLGSEIPIYTNILEEYPKVYFYGSIDFGLYHKKTNTIELYDIKTSKRGWGQWQKSDKIKVSQLILYKYYFSKLFRFDIDRISATYFILKSELPDDNDVPYVPKPVQIFQPPQKKVSINKAVRGIEAMVRDCFTVEGEYIDKEYTRTKTPHACRFCPFYGKKELCDSETLEEN